MSKWLFTKEEDEKFLIEKNNENRVLKNTMWNDITTRVGKSVDDYKNYWKNIKDICMVSQNKETDSVSRSRKNWSISTRIPFLDIIYKRNTTSNVGEIEDELEGCNVPLLKKK